jgi:hypothetical protein
MKTIFGKQNTSLQKKQLFFSILAIALFVMNFLTSVSVTSLSLLQWLWLGAFALIIALTAIVTARFVKSQKYPHTTVMVMQSAYLKALDNSFLNPHQAISDHGTAHIEYAE